MIEKQPTAEVNVQDWESGGLSLWHPLVNKLFPCGALFPWLQCGRVGLDLAYSSRSKSLLIYDASEAPGAREVQRKHTGTLKGKLCGGTGTCTQSWRMGRTWVTERRTRGVMLEKQQEQSKGGTNTAGTLLKASWDQPSWQDQEAERCQTTNGLNNRKKKRSLDFVLEAGATIRRFYAGINC